MNGMQRFLSRREKHQAEKRKSKEAARNKVRSISANSFIPLLWHSDSRLEVGWRGPSRDWHCRPRQPTSGLESVYHKLPAALRSSVEDRLLFLHAPCRATSTPDYAKLSTMDSSDHVREQRKSGQPASSDLYKIFTNEDAKTTVDRDAAKNVTMLLSRLQSVGITSMGTEQAEHALAWYPDDIDQAYDVLVLANESIEGELKDYDPNVKMVGAINRNMVTCYLDALLFAMFARLDAFEAMLFDNFDDEPRKKLAATLRLWVNLLRTGRLVKVELTKHLQDALAECGWEDAARVCQQDASEAFTFITGALELPLLTLKMDIYHTGREDKEDDHKFVNERLLEVAIPEQEGEGIITLEDCLETYFNNRIEVKRFLQRQNTIGSVRSATQDTVDRDPEKNETIHVESLELLGPESPMVSTPVSMAPSTPLSAVRPLLDGRRRADSIFSQRFKNAEDKKFDEKKHLDDMLNNSSDGRPRSASLLRKEVLMPAWQFFSLIPWYTDNVPKTDAQVAAHFSARRPVLGICLKRYSMTMYGAPKRLNTYVDIPLEIALPHFVSDDRIAEEGPLFGNFKLVLQSVVCHRGVSVDSGHYISLIRANEHRPPGTSQSEEDDDTWPWLRFDDLSNPRVTDVDIKKALREESPYLLFYQVQPIDDELASRGDPPTYTEAQNEVMSAVPSWETLNSMPEGGVTDAESGGEWDKVKPADVHPESVVSDDPIGRASMSSNRRSSVAFDDIESFSRGRTEPHTPSDEYRAGFLSASRRGSRTWLGTKSRPTSQTGEGRLSLTLSRLTGRGSKDKLAITEGGAAEDPIIVINAVESQEHSPPESGSPAKEHREPTASPKKSSKKKDHHRSKSRDVSELAEKKLKDKNRPDRECAVM
ncbi:ubiquitin C-terminal hydrolase family protein [Didymella exigua CBS 183.55]|uniref:ubiquitinyl hydrolase 1 n=1 Tax=Didymella exigua CBS 183.55 TaxID=1150837 RepID=A0A6A5S8C2_9PLEO|nr:ubiquitin C-terminal hydrolase family protein [Didymella exigua CBS 183.55]KAF1933757.1 ubiquitin C-terminal hydrolase family protein [Didymella exigua CBS 183.55]